MVDLLELLKQSRDRISDPDRWTQKAMARAESGMSCLPSDDDAVQWCAIGVLHRINGENVLGVGVEHLALDDAIEALQMVIRRENRTAATISDYNDARTHSEVVRIFDKAIEEVKTRRRWREQVR